MIFLLKHFHNITGFAACVCWFFAASTSDYHTMVSGDPEPVQVWKLLIIGAVLMIPTVIHVVIENRKERRRERYL